MRDPSISARRLVQRFLRADFPRHPMMLPVPPEEDVAIDPKKLKDANKLLSRAIQTQIRKRFTPRGLPFFLLYIELRKVSFGMPAPPDLAEQYKTAVRQIVRIKSPVDKEKLSPSIINDLVSDVPKMRTWLARISKEGASDVLWKKVVTIYGANIVRVTRDKQLYIRGVPRGAQRWMTFRKMRPKEEVVEKLKDTDPQSYEAVMRNRMTRKQLDARMASAVEAGGMVHEKTRLMHRLVHMGVDPVTGEKRIFTIEGDVLTIDEFKAKVIKEREETKAAKKKLLPEEQLKALRKFSDEDLAELEGGDVKFVALTDGAAGHMASTKIYPTRRAFDSVVVSERSGAMEVVQVGRRVVTDGRYKGCFVDDLVNAQGRLIEGTSYVYTKQGRSRRTVAVKSDPSFREPYMTVSKERPDQLYLTVPGRRGKRGEGLHPDTVIKNALKALARKIPPPGMEYAGTSREEDPGKKGKKQQKAAFFIAPENFSVVREAIQSMSLSSNAQQTLSDYFRDLARAEEATQAENLKFYSAEQIGGFKSRLRKRDGTSKPFDLLTKQKQALAWLEANGDKGVVALDTGVGKCVQKDTLCLTNRGLVPIGDLNPGDLDPDTSSSIEGWSVAVNGGLRPVKSFYFGGEKPTLKITTRNYFGIEGSLIHPLLVFTAGGVLDWIKTPDLVEGDYLCVSREEGFFPEEEPSITVPEAGRAVAYPVPQKMTPDFARLLGYIVAEGWTKGKKTFAISQSPEKNPEVRADIEALLKSQFGWWKERFEGVKDIQIASRFLLRYLGTKDLQVSGSLPKGKVVPPAILRSTRETMRQFLRGYVDAKCSIREGGIELSSASEKLSRTVQLMLLRFGIVSRRRPKLVKGREHLYWITEILGEDARLFMGRIGLVSKRKVEALAPHLEKEGNPNRDVVPHMAPLVQDMHREIMSRWEGNVAFFRERFGSSVYNTMNHVRLGRRNASYRFLRELLSTAQELGCEKTEPYQEIQVVIDLNYFYDPIQTIEKGFSVVMDIEVDDPSHCFVGNGLVNHNTLTSIAMMQKLLRDGWAEEGSGTNGRFLYVSPPALVGNVVSQAADFLETEAKDELISRLDVLSFAQFRTARGRNKATVVRKVSGKNQKFVYDPWNPEAYIAVFFDEAQELAKNPGNKGPAAAFSLNHPRKIALTASPMEREPMEAYLLSAMCNNIDLSQKGPEGRRLRRDMSRFKERFCEEIGGRVMGLKKSPDADEDEVVRRDLHTWVKRNIFHADKKDIEEFDLPDLTQETITLTMSPPVERAYRKASKGIRKQLVGLAAKFRDKGYVVTSEDPLTGEKKYQKLPIAFDKEIEKWASVNMKPLIKTLHTLLLTPEKLVEGVEDNPKISEAARLIKSDMGEDTDNPQGYTLLFSDNPSFVLQSAKGLSSRIPGKIHVGGIGKKIHFYKNGKEMKSYRVQRMVEGKIKEAEHRLPFTPRKMLLFPGQPQHDVRNPGAKSADWQSFVLNQIVQQDSECLTCTLAGKVYNTGQNLQGFGTVIQLDRNTWNSESMKQRTARSWRQGQENPVKEITLDMRFRRPKDDLDKTLDEIRELFQQLSGELFDKIIKEAQTTALGKEWSEMEKRNAEFMRLDDKTMELVLSPYLDSTST